MSARGRRRPATARGEETVRSLLNAATTAFSEHGFHQTSVAAICRHANLANGTFYQYFPNKESIYLELVADTGDELLHSLDRSVSADEPAMDQLADALRAYWQFIEGHADRHQIMREAEFVRLDVSQTFYRRLAEFYRALVERGQARDEVPTVDPEALAYALIGLSEFLALRYLIWNRDFSERVTATVADWLSDGVARAGASDPLDVDGRPFDDVVKANGLGTRTDGDTRAHVLAAAETEFGLNGFHAASVADIARRAGVAHGTVYRYFPSKEALFAEVVREINRQLRARIRQRTAALPDRRSAEHEGFRAFFGFIGEHARMYRVVREAEFVGAASERVGTWYYQRLAEGYAQGIEAAIRRNEWRDLDADVLTWALMGIAHFWGLRWIVWERIMPPTGVTRVLDRLLQGGLAA